MNLDSIFGLSPGDLRGKARKAAGQINKVLLGKEFEVRQVLLTLLAGGNILLEDLPGVGKTTLALAFSKTLDLDFRRVQFTPDVMPSDLTGFSLYRRDMESFVYQQGSVFCNLLLADELNRASPKTQSALLEVMEEHHVTVEGITRPVPDPFFVIATQNPVGSAGTQALPETQIDRFMSSLSLGYPDFEHELEMLRTTGEEGRTESLSPVLSRDDVLAMRHAVTQVFVHEDVSRYLLELVRATRESPLLRRGGSPRASVSLLKLSKSAAWYRGRDYVTPTDVEEQFPFVLRHRMVSGPAARIENMSRTDIVREILKTVQKPGMGKPF